MNNTKSLAMKAVASGIVAGVGTKWLFGDYGDMNYFGMELSTAMANGLAVGLGSVGSDVFSEQVIRRLSLNNQIINGSTLAVQAGLCGGISSGLLYFGSNIPVGSLPLSFGLGAGSKLIGDYVDYKVFDPRNGIIGPIF